MAWDNRLRSCWPLVFFAPEGDNGTLCTALQSSVLAERGPRMVTSQWESCVAKGLIVTSLWAATFAFPPPVISATDDKTNAETPKGNGNDGFEAEIVHEIHLSLSEKEFK